MKTESQNNRILEYLKSGRSLTAYTALVKFETLRLSARINNLRDQGHNIKSEMEKLSNGKRVARYSYID